MVIRHDTLAILEKFLLTLKLICMFLRQFSLYNIFKSKTAPRNDLENFLIKCGNLKIFARFLLALKIKFLNFSLDISYFIKFFNSNYF